MAAIRIILYIFSALFMLSLVCLFLPWDTLNALMLALGAEAYPDTPLVIYSIKGFLLLGFWLGVLLAIATRRPLVHERVLLTFGGLGLSFTLAAVILGWTYGVGNYFYADAISGLILGILALLHRRNALRAAGEA